MNFFTGKLSKSIFLIYNFICMKRSTFLLIFCLFVGQIYAQGGFSTVLSNHARNTKLVKKLKNFQNQGIEKSLDLGSLTADQLIATAKTYLGTKHKMGGVDKNGIDCSGLLFASFRDNKLKVPHGSQAMAHYGKIIVDMKDLKRGDLVFSYGTYTTKKVITHSGIYLGDGKFIHTSSRKGVIISNLKHSKYWQDSFLFGTRIF